MKKKNLNITWQKVLYDVVNNIRTDVTSFLSYILSVTIQIALLYYIMKILGEFAIFIFEKNGIIDPAQLDIIPVLIWCFSLIYIITRTDYKR